MSLSRARKRVVFVQLPMPDNDVSGDTENLPQAAHYLRHALERTGETRWFDPVIAAPYLDRLDNRNAAQAILDLQPDILAVTLYMWNVERTLRVLRDIRRRIPRLFVMAGGPEVARRHPFLFRHGTMDVVVSGEGEPVMGGILRAIRTGRRADFSTVAWRYGRSYRWGARIPPRMELSDMLPPANHPSNRPALSGMAYLETIRGCVSECAFCRYRRQFAGVSRLPVPDVIERIRVLRQRGTVEIRFIDPTFNSRPDFADLLRGIARLNADRKLRFFAEIRADTVTDEIARLLAAANVREVEVGIQSLDQAVLHAVNRPSDIERVHTGIAFLARHGISTTLDLMCGLPCQTLKDVRAGIRQLARVKRGKVQLLHTLLIPGSDLRDRRTDYGIRAQARPPYRVIKTPTMSETDFAEADRLVRNITGIQYDSPSGAFVGSRLSRLFDERVNLGLDRRQRQIGGRANRRALLFRHGDLFGKREAIIAIMNSAMRGDPDMLWQFVLCPEHEEPLDLIDAMIDTIRKRPRHFLDLGHPCASGTRLVARRIFVLLRAGKRYDTSWIAATDRLLGDSFY